MFYISRRSPLFLYSEEFQDTLFYPFGFLDICHGMFLKLTPQLFVWQTLGYEEGGRE